MNEAATLEYAVCTQCGLKFANAAEVQAHSAATMAATGESGVTAKGHAWRVVNPTPEEKAERRVRNAVAWAIEDAVNEFIQTIERRVDRGDLTNADVTEALRSYPDFADGWDEYMSEVLA